MRSLNDQRTRLVDGDATTTCVEDLFAKEAFSLCVAELNDTLCVKSCDLEVRIAQMGERTGDYTPVVDDRLEVAPLNVKKKLPFKYRKGADKVFSKYTHRVMFDRNTKRVPEEFNAQMDSILDMFKLRVEGGVRPEQFDVISNVASSLEKLVVLFSEVSDVNNLREVPIATLAASVGESVGDGVFSSLVDNVKSVLEKVVEVLGPMAIGCSVAVLVAVLYAKYGLSKVFVGLLFAIAAVFVFIKRDSIGDCLMKFAMYVSARLEIVEIEPTVESEEFVSEMVDSSVLVDLITMLLGYIAMPNSFNKREFIRFVGDFGRVMPAADNIVAMVLRVSQRVVDFACTKLGYESVTIVSTMMPKVDRWVKDAKSVISKISMNTMIHDQATHDVILSLEDRAYELLTMVANDRKNPVVGPLIRPIVAALEQIRRGLVQEGVCETQTRQAPVIVVYSGESGVGKTFIERNVVASTIALTQDQDTMERFRLNPEDFTYSRMVENPFWDGYHGQLVCVFDEKDLVHKNHLTSQNSDTELIRSGNTFQYPLHMASLEQKANTFFRSKIIIATTNVAHTSIAAQESVRYPDAVVNRIDFEISVRLKKEFATVDSVLANPTDATTWKLDKTKLPADGSFDPSIYNFVKYEMERIPGTTNQRRPVDGKTYTYEEHLVSIAQVYRQKEAAALRVPLNDKAAFEYGALLRARHFSAEMDEFVDASEELDDFYVPGLTPHPWSVQVDFEALNDDEGHEEDNYLLADFREFRERLIDARELARRCASLFTYVPHHTAAHFLFPEIRRRYVEELRVMSKWTMRRLVTQFVGAYAELLREFVNTTDEEDVRIFFSWYNRYMEKLGSCRSYLKQAKEMLDDAVNGVSDYHLRWLAYVKTKCDAVFGVRNSVVAQCIISGIAGASFGIFLNLFCTALINYFELPQKFGQFMTNFGFKVPKATRREGNTFMDKILGLQYESDVKRASVYARFGMNPSPRISGVKAQSDAPLENTLDNWFGLNFDSWTSSYKKMRSFFGMCADEDIGERPVCSFMDIVKEEPGKVDAVAQLYDGGLEAVVMKLWSKSYYSIRCGATNLHLGWGFFSHANVFNFCVHYANVWKARGEGEETIELCRDGKRPLVYKKSVFFSNTKISVDHACVALKSCENHADIRELFADVSDLVLRPTGVVMIVKKKGDTVVNIFTRYAMDFKTDYTDSESNVYKHPVCIRYDVKTEGGDCGMPLFIVDPTTRNKKFIGFHVAGSGTFGLGYVFNSPSLDVACAEMFERLPVSMEKIGTIPRPIGTSGETSIRRSELWGAWDKPAKKPSRLRPFLDKEGTRVFPMERAILRYDKEILKYDQDLVNVCVRDAVRANTQGFSFRELPRKVSMEVAVAGIPGVDFMDAMNRSTSSGYPWSMRPRPGYKGKQRFLGKNEDIDFSGPDWLELVTEVRDTEMLLEQGVRPNFYFSDSLKDELVKEAKYLSGDTRLFCASPIVYQVLFGMYFKEFLQKFMQNRITGEHIVGVNVYSEEWEMVYRKITKHGVNNAIAGDFKSFDASQSAQILEAIGEQVIESFADREYDEIRRILWMEVFNSRHVVGTDIIEWKQSLASGHGATTPINCMFVGTVFRMCFLKLAEKDLSYIREFKEHVELLAYGDDQVLSISPAVCSWYNQSTITEAMAYFGLTYTPEDKDAVVEDLRNVKDIQFISRGFRYEPLLGRHVAPLKIKSIIDMPMWTKKNGAELITVTNLDNALRELSLHPQSVFDEWAPLMLRAARLRLNYVPAISDRKTLLFETVKKEINYANRLGLFLSDPSRRVNSGNLSSQDLESDGNKHFLEDNKSDFSAEMGESLYIHIYPTRTGRVKQCPGGLEEACWAQVGPAMSIRPAVNMNNNNMSLSTSTDVAQVGTTSMLNQASVSSAKRDNFSEIPQGLLKATRVGVDQSSIYDFLRKPIKVGSFSLNTTYAAGTSVFLVDLPMDAFSQAIYADKIRGFLGFKAKTVLRLQVNANRFQQGRLLMTYVPQGNENGTFATTRMQHLITATQLPRVELDLSTQTESIMEIPYVSPTPFYNLRSGVGAIGRVFVNVYSPLKVGTGTTHADLTLWVNFEDIELVAPAIAQVLDVQAKELEVMEGKGASAAANVTGAISAVKDAAASLYEICTRPSWALSALAHFASAYGWAKPTSETAVTKIQPLFNFNMQNHNGVDVFPNMGLDAANRLEQLPGGAGSSLDEMSISHIIQKPAFVTSLTWLAAHAPGSSLTNFLVEPLYGTFVSASNGFPLRKFTPVGYLANFFQFWRGSFVLTIKIVKTQYHSGRLAITYNPGGIIADLDTGAFLLREIIDIRETSEFKFVIPYTSTEQYLSTGVFGSVNADNIGSISILVLNDLVRPDTCADNVQLLLEWSAGPDFEYACPKHKTIRTMMLSAQMADRVDESTSSAMIVKPIGTSSQDLEEIVPSLYCMGEKILSIKQLLNRYCPTMPDLVDDEYYTLDFRPFAICTQTDLSATLPPINGDLYSLFAPCFAYSRGSMRVMTVPRTFVDDTAQQVQHVPHVVVYPEKTVTTVLRDLTMPLSYRGPAHNYQYGNGDYAPIGVSVPPYQQYHLRLNRLTTPSINEAVDSYTSCMRVCVSTVYNNTPTKTWIYRAMGDDASLSFWLGAPACTLSVPS